VCNHVVEPTSILVSRRARRAKTDRLDGQGLLRVLAAYDRGDKQVCSLLCVPAPEEEHAKRPRREHEHLMQERVRIENSIEALLLTQGICKRLSLRRRQRVELGRNLRLLGCAVVDHRRAGRRRRLLRTGRSAAAQQAPRDRENGELPLPASSAEPHCFSQGFALLEGSAEPLAGARAGEQQEDDGSGGEREVERTPRQSAAAQGGEKAGDHRRPRFQSSSRA
jgi:hypothetical protein